MLKGNESHTFQRSLVFGAIIVFAVILRLINLGKYSFWHDEAIYFLTSQDAVAILAGHSAIKGTLFFQLQAFLWGYLGKDLFVLRLLPVLWSVLGVLVTFRFAAYLYDRRTALFASFLAALSPFSIHYAQEFKMYSMMISLSLVSYYLFYRFLTELRTEKLWRYLSLVNALLLFTHYFGVFVIAVEIIYFTFCSLKSDRNTSFMLSLLGSFMLYFPWFIGVEIQYLSVIGDFNASWIPAWNLLKPLISLYHFSAGYQAPLKIGIAITVLFLGLLLKVIVYDLGGKDARRINPTFYLILAVFGPLFLASMLALWKDIYLDRYLVFVTGPLLIAVGRGLAVIRKPLFQRSLVILLAISFFLPIAYIYQNRVPREDKTTIYVKKDVISAARILDKKVQPGDLVINSSWSVIAPLLFHMERPVCLPHVVLTAGKFRHFSMIGGDFVYNPDLLPHPLPLTVADYNRIWLVHSSWPTSSETVEPRMVKQWMFDHYDLVEQNSLLGIDIFLFQTRQK